MSSSNDLRKVFLQYFEQHRHKIIASSSLVPGNDPTLLFTNAGMVQFKDVFLGREPRPAPRAVSSQRCVRAGGKHNDLENVGYTTRHHTFFEMLGNFSFGDYFKQEAIVRAWELLTVVYKIPAEKLTVTTYTDDQEAYDIWTQQIGLPDNKVVRIGDNKGAKYASDNFWMMGDTGPCGPCTEIFYDHGAQIAGGPPGSKDEDGDRFVEIWNLVFMQYNRDDKGVMHKLPNPSVDTGMGLERLAAVMQGVHSNYDIDLFKHLIAHVSALAGVNANKNSMQVIADHIRSVAFLVTDGVLPANEGRGYVLRRIIRRALRHGHKLNLTEPFFYTLVDVLERDMGAAYPELSQAKTRVAQAIKDEEIRFAETLDQGMKHLDVVLAKLESREIPGKDVFILYDTFGFPVDLTADFARERGLSIDFAGYQSEMESQRTRARSAGKFKMEAALDYAGANSAFTGYTDLKADAATVLALYRKDGTPASGLSAGEDGIVVLDTTPFYAESGGQVGDSGELSNAQTVFTVRDTQKVKADVVGHHGVVSGARAINVGDKLSAQVNRNARTDTMRNHSATHLMHKALRDVLGDHVQQKGSEVNAERTRFDFAHNAPMTDAQIRAVEAQVNAEILLNAETHARVMPIDDAKKTGAMMLFGEKYGTEVRVLDIGNSRELCGGTHVARTGDIGLFKIISETGVASGVRRVEAISGRGALAYIADTETRLENVSARLKANRDNVADKVEQLLDRSKQLEKEVQALKGKLASGSGSGLSAQAVQMGNAKLLAAQIADADAATLRDTVDQLKNKLGSAVVLLATIEDGKVRLAAGVTKDLTAKVSAGELVNFVAQQVGGKGGGRADMAQAGGTEPDKLPAALASVAAWVRAKLT